MNTWSSKKRKQKRGEKIFKEFSRPDERHESSDLGSQKPRINISKYTKKQPKCPIVQLQIKKKRRS